MDGKVAPATVTGSARGQLLLPACVRPRPGLCCQGAVTQTSTRGEGLGIRSSCWLLQESTAHHVQVHTGRRGLVKTQLPEPACGGRGRLAGMVGMVTWWVWRRGQAPAGDTASPFRATVGVLATLPIQLEPDVPGQAGVMA